MNTTLGIGVMATFACAYLILGLLASRKVKTTTDYFLAGRDLGIIPVTFTLIATELGGGILIGTSSQAFLYGIYGILYTTGTVIGFLMLALGFASILRGLNVSTTAELFETHYGSKRLKQFASLLSILTLCGLLVGQIVASRGIVTTLTGGSEFLFLLFWFFVIVYTMLGGLHAVVVTDTYQVLFIIIVFSGVFLYSLFNAPVGLSALIQAQTDLFDSHTLTLSQASGILLMPALFALIEQDLAQRFFAARTRTIATISAGCAGIFMLFFSLIPIYFGMIARIAPINAMPNTALLDIISVLTSDFIIILVSCGLMAAITSTADSLLCAISSNVALDFDLSWTGITNLLTRSKWLTLLIGISALLASYSMPSNVIEILENSYALSVSALFVPLMFAYFGAKPSKNGAIAAIICGLGTYLFIPFLPPNLPKHAVALVFSLAGYGIGRTTRQYK